MTESVIVLNPVLTSFSLDSASLDSFGRIRVGEPLTLWDTQFQYGKCPNLWEERTQGVGSVATHLPNESSIEFFVGPNASDFVIRQSHNYLRYKPGKSQLVLISVVFGQQENQVRRAGLFDDDNGVFLEVRGDELLMVLRSKISGNVVNSAIPQEEWNLNKLDGSDGGYTLDITKSQIFCTDLEWLGVGRVRVGLIIDGRIIYVHQFLHANILSTTYMTTANLPIRYEVRNLQNQVGVTSGFKQICSTVISEGGESTSKPDSIRSASTNLGSAVNVPSGSPIPIISLRLAPLVNGITNRGQIKPIGVDVLVVANREVYWEMLLNPSLTGASVWSSPDSESIAEINLNASSVAGGIRIFSGFVQGNAQSKEFTPFNKTFLSRNFDSTNSDVLTIAARSVDNLVSQVFVVIHWEEFAC